MAQIIPIIIQLLGGAAGGNIIGVLLKNANLSAMMRTVLGAIGGVGGTQLAGMMGLLQSMLGEAAGQGSMIAGNAAASAVGGGLLTLIVGLIKQMMGGQKA